MPKDSPSLAALIGSRICHDLISPIGAISNGLELVSMTGGGGMGPEMSLIRQSCDNAAARIRFFRIAFGFAEPQQQVKTAEAAGILADHYRDTRITALWSDGGPGTVSRREVQRAFLGALCLESTLPQGGTIRLGASAGGAPMVLQSQGETRAPDPALWNRLRTGRPEEAAAGVSPAQVQFTLLAHLLADAGMAAHVESAPGRVTLTLRQDGIS